MTLRPWGNESVVNTTTANNQTNSVVAALTGGGYVVAWVDDMGAGGSVVKFQRYDALGRHLGLETALPAPDGDGGNQGEPSIAAMPDGGFVIAVTDDDGFSIPEVHLLRFTATGSLVFDSAQGYAAAPMVSVSPTTIYLTSRVDIGVTNEIILAMSDYNGNLLAGTTLETSPTTHSLLQTSTFHPTGGLVYSAYLDTTGQITLQTFDGATLTLLGPGLTPGANPFDINDLDIKVLPNGNVIMGVGVLNGSYQLAILDAQGFIISAPSIGLSGTNAGDIVAFADNTFALVYRDMFSTTSKLNVYDAVGNIVTTANLSPNLTGGEEFSIDKLADGRIIVTWTTNDGAPTDIYQQIIDPRDGNVQGNNNPALAETLTGHDALGDIIYGYAGNDTMHGLAGNDVMYGGAGDDVQFGGRGDDTMYGGADNDSMVGDAGNDVLYGGSGNDVLRGMAGDDEHYGESGNDTLIGGLGSDLMDGGAGGVDTLDYQFSSGVNVNIQTNVASGGDAQGDAISNFENLYGSEFNDVLTGNTGVNVLVGRGGNDTINGGDAGDTINGGSGINTLNGDGGDDTFFGGVGADTINGGAGLLDLVNYNASTSGVTVNLATNIHSGGDAGNDSLSNVERVIGSNFVDFLTGDAQANSLFGLNGIDTLQGGLGNDSLTGGIDADFFVFTEQTAGNATFGADTIQDFLDGTDRLRISTAIATDFSNIGISGNGTTQVVLTIDGQSITIKGAAPITISNADIDFV